MMKKQDVSVWIVVQSERLCGDEMELGIIYVMLADSITRWMEWIVHSWSSRED